MKIRRNYQVHSTISSLDEKDESISLHIRCNGKLFVMETSPEQFISSPSIAEKYRICLQVIRGDEEEIDDIYEEDAEEWLSEPLEPLFAELAPCPPGVLEGHTQVPLNDYLNPEIISVSLGAADDEFKPRRVYTECSPLVPFAGAGLRPEHDFAKELRTWATLVDPSTAIVRFKNPGDALMRRPEKVVLENHGQTAHYFLKQPRSAMVATKELITLKAIADANIDPKLKICRLHGVIMDQHERLGGILLNYIDCDGDEAGPMAFVIDADFPELAIKQRMWIQIEEAVSALHKAGIVWGNVKAENILIDKDNNAWITDFGGGYTPGWVKPELQETMKGDLKGMKKVKNFLFSTKKRFD